MKKRFIWVSATFVVIMIYGALAVGWAYRNDNLSRTLDQTGLRTYSPRAEGVGILTPEPRNDDPLDGTKHCIGDSELCDGGPDYPPRTGDWAQYSKITKERMSDFHGTYDECFTEEMPKVGFPYRTQCKRPGDPFEPVKEYE
jgi:hypothetical protein